MGRKRNPTVFKIAEQFTIKDMAKYHKDFTKAVNEERDIVVDLNTTETIDFSGLQLLLGLKKSCKEKNLDISLENINEGTIKKIKLCGLENSLLKGASHGSI
jgi:anti-anti-sigma factor